MKTNIHRLRNSELQILWAESTSARPAVIERAAIVSDGARVLRGGGWNNNAGGLRVFARLRLILY